MDYGIELYILDLFKDLEDFIVLPNDHFNVSAFSVESNLEMSILCCTITLLELVYRCQMNDFGEQVSRNEASPKTTC